MTNGLRVKDLSLAALMLCGAGCAPKIYRFDVLPYTLCVGTKAVVTWQIKGTPELTLTPDASPVSTQPLTYAPLVETKFVLHAKEGGAQATASTSVTVYPAGGIGTNNMVFNPTCAGKALTAVVNRPATEWDPRIRVKRVSSDQGRNLTIAHEGRTATLTTAAPSTTAFDGTSIAGTWNLTAPLQVNEQCSDPKAPPLTLVRLTHHIVCSK